MLVFEAIDTPKTLLAKHPDFDKRAPSIFDLVNQIQPDNLKHLNNSEQQELASRLVDECEKFLANIDRKSRAENEPQQILRLQAQAVDFLYGNKPKPRKKILSDKNRKKARMAYQDLHKIHEQEHHFKGNIEIFYWLSKIRQGISLTNSYKDIIAKVNPVPYFDPETRKQFQVHFNNGKLHHLSDQGLVPICTDKVLDNQREREGYRLYVLDIHGNFYVDNWPDVTPDSFCHSSFLSGETVQCAGLIKIENGTLKEISIESGHYRPKPDHLLKTLNILQNNHRVDLSSVDVVYMHEEKNKTPWLYRCKADKYLRQKGLALSENILAGNAPEKNSALYMDDESENISEEHKATQVDQRLNMLFEIQGVISDTANKPPKNITNDEQKALQSIANKFYEVDYTQFKNAHDLQKWAQDYISNTIKTPHKGLIERFFQRTSSNHLKSSLLQEIGKLLPDKVHRHRK